MSAPAITPFTISISDDAITDLGTRLRTTRWPEQLPGPAWQRGVPVDYLRRVADYWADGFDWRAHEERINGFPSSPPTSMASESISCTSGRRAMELLPLLLLHGWPGSFVEFLDVIGPLRRPRRARRRPRRRLPRCRSVAAWFRLLDPVRRRRLGQPRWPRLWPS